MLTILPYLFACVGLGVLTLGITGALILCAGMTKQEPDCDYIIVLGSKIENGKASLTLHERLDRAERYLSAHPTAKAILSGGQGEAAYMLQTLVAAGIAADRLIPEKNSTSTWQNLKFSLPLTEGASVDRVGILSSDFHFFRAKMYLKTRKIPLVPAKTKDFPRWLRAYIREIAGVWHYILLGGTYD